MINLLCYPEGFYCSVIQKGRDWVKPRSRLWNNTSKYSHSTIYLKWQTYPTGLILITCLKGNYKKTQTKLVLHLLGWGFTWVLVTSPLREMRTHKKSSSQLDLYLPSPRAQIIYSHCSSCLPLCAEVSDCLTRLAPDSHILNKKPKTMRFNHC